MGSVIELKSTHLEWMAFSIGTIGTILWALGFKYKGRPLEGWFWLASSILWIWFSYINGHKGLASRDLLGLILYIIGIAKIYKETRPKIKATSSSQ